jgi:predicted NodU family carbamoyl transferase
MARTLGLNAAFHDSSAALVVDGAIVAAAEEDRFSRRRHAMPRARPRTWASGAPRTSTR